MTNEVVLQVRNALKENLDEKTKASSKTVSTTYQCGCNGGNSKIGIEF